MQPPDSPGPRRSERSSDQTGDWIHSFPTDHQHPRRDEPHADAVTHALTCPNVVIVTRVGVEGLEPPTPSLYGIKARALCSPVFMQVVGERNVLS